MRRITIEGQFQAWRAQARQLLGEGLPPEALLWEEAQGQGDLLAACAAPAASPPADSPVRLPRALLAQLEEAARYRSADRWGFLYRVLWRYARGDGAVLLAGDPDGSELHRRLRQVRRELHQMKAFLRFHRQATEDGSECYLAWYAPRHEVLDLVAEHFAARLGLTRWAIVTPDAALLGDGREVHQLCPCPPELARRARQPDDPAQDLWRSYYRSTFNPARLNEALLRRHLPARLWTQLPEGGLIGELIGQARRGGQRLGQAAALAGRPGRRIRSAGERNEEER